MSDERLAYYRDISSRLREMIGLFDDQQGGASYRGYFEETLDANELEIALHALWAPARAQ
jgi:hypothetical protein